MMKTTEIVTRGPVADPNMSELLDQLDPAIGEASSVMGAMATELIRRSLRGGVMQIGRELNGYVAQQVEQQIVEQRPAIEKAAAETATEVARGEVGAVRQAVQEQERQLAGRIEETSRQAQQQVETFARDLTGRLDESTRQTHERIETVAKAADETAQTLHTEVAAAQTRTLDSARQELETFKERARETTQKIKFRLDRLDAKSHELADLQSAVKQELLDIWRTERQHLADQIEELRRARAALAQRVEILEQPRGLRRLFAWLFGEKKPPINTDEHG